MIVRLSQKLNSRVKAGKLEPHALADNPFVDWSCHSFNVSRTQYIIFCNTDTLLSCVSLRNGVTSPATLTQRALETIGSFLSDLGYESIFEEHIRPEAEHVQFAKALNRSVTGSINDLVLGVKYGLDDGLTPNEVSNRLIETPLSALKARDSHGYGCPDLVFEQLANGHSQ
ncbi:MAG: hypothetical protein AAF497_13650 [Planctomycetota bacterium]